MQFEPKTREQAEKESQFPLWEEGVYSFAVAKSEPYKKKGSSEGNDMIKLTLNVHNDHGQVQVIFDYLTAKMPLKLLDACEAMGVMSEYETGTLEAEQLQDKTGNLRLVKKGESKDKEGKTYPPRNEVKTYIPNALYSAHSEAKANGYAPDNDFSVNDSEIPF